MIDWSEPTCQVTEHFTVKDALWLHSWDRLASAGDGADFDKLKILLNKMEEIREILQCPIFVHSCFRSQIYNKQNGIRPFDDVHSMNIACDFDTGLELSVQSAQALLEPKLEELGIRMERGTTSWVHVDLRKPGISGRYFNA